MTKRLGMSATVEGVETEEQVRLARELGADVAQGFYFGKPVDAGTIGSWIAAGVTGLPR
jgi:EAL domain-containing protein (putative c-di-GMP-specific phosphodiesterase class I)